MNRAIAQVSALVVIAMAAPLRAQTVAPLQPNGEQLRAENAPTDAIWLETLDLNTIEQGFGKVAARKTVDGNALKLKGMTYAHGIGTHAVSEINLDLSGGATRFEAMAGVDDETGGKGSVQFMVRVDGKTLVRTPVLKGGDAPFPIAVDLTGARKLSLRVYDGDDGIDFDHADWGGATLYLAPNATQKPKMVRSLVSDSAPPPIAMTVASEPAIHGPRITGATPGRPFLFKIPATGVGPLRFRAKNLPAGLQLDAKSGIITGSLQKDGVSVVTLQVAGPKSKASRKLTIVGGRDKLALTPPMGWNSWNIYYCDVNEQKVRDAADWLVKTGLINHGYQYVNIDDCWQAARNADGTVGVNQKFGDMKVLGDRLHAQGFKFGIYSSPGPQTCAGYEGSYRHEAQDVQSYVNWGVDYLKYDWCSYGGVAARESGPELEKLQKPYRLMGDLLANADRDIVHSLCQYGMGDVSRWGDSVKGNLWRTTGDIAPSYGSMSNIGFNQIAQQPFARPGNWNDPDMLFMHALNPNEQLTHLSLWSILAAPLLIGSDLSKVSPFTIAALGNDEVIDVDQDPLGIQGRRVFKQEMAEVWSRPLWDGTIAVALFNRDVDPATVTAKWSDLGLKGAQPVRDLWQQKNLPQANGAFSALVPAHGAVMLKIGKPKKVDAFLPSMLPPTQTMPISAKIAALQKTP